MLQIRLNWGDSNFNLSFLLGASSEDLLRRGASPNVAAYLLAAAMQVTDKIFQQDEQDHYTVLPEFQRPVSHLMITGNMYRQRKPSSGVALSTPAY